MENNRPNTEPNASCAAADNKSLLPKSRRKLDAGSQVGIVCCSNGQPEKRRESLSQLKCVLEESGLVPIFSDYIYEKDSVFSGTARERAGALMDFYVNPGIKAIFDISGGDLANEILPYLDFHTISQNPKQFWGYSDLSTILNAIYTKTGLPSVLYQIKHLVAAHAKSQQQLFFNTLLHGQSSLYDFPYTFIQGNQMEGIVVGGNIRCFLKLAGTEFFPDLRNKILVLESLNGHVPQMVTYLSQLQLLGAFKQVNGILLGTFTQMEQDKDTPDMVSLVKRYAGSLPVAKTQKIGHGTDSCGIVIGEYRKFS